MKVQGFVFHHNRKDYFFVTNHQRLSHSLIEDMTLVIGVHPQTNKEYSLCKAALDIRRATLEVGNGKWGVYYKINGDGFGMTNFAKDNDTVIINLEV